MTGAPAFITQASSDMEGLAHEHNGACLKVKLQHLVKKPLQLVSILSSGLASAEPSLDPIDLCLDCCKLYDPKPHQFITSICSWNFEMTHRQSAIVFNGSSEMQSKAQSAKDMVCHIRNSERISSLMQRPVTAIYVWRQHRMHSVQFSMKTLHSA